MSTDKLDPAHVEAYNAAVENFNKSVQRGDPPRRQRMFLVLASQRLTELIDDSIYTEEDYTWEPTREN